VKTTQVIAIRKTVEEEELLALKARRRMLKIAHRRERRTMRQILKLGLIPEEMIGNA
jgi:hypothetical protein